MCAGEIQLKRALDETLTNFPHVCERNVEFVAFLLQKESFRARATKYQEKPALKKANFPHVRG
jgi:hypothetical protein